MYLHGLLNIIKSFFFCEWRHIGEVLEGGGGGITQRFSISLFLGSFMVCQFMNN